MSIAKHATYNLLGSIVPLAVSLVTVPLYLSAIGLERYGVLALCWTLLGYMGFLNLGLGPSVAQKMAMLRSADSAERASVFWTAIWVSLAMGAAAGLLVYGLAGLYFSSLKDLPIGLSGEIAGAKGWLAAIIPVVMLSSVLTGALQGHERFLAMNIITSSTSVLMSVAPLAVAYAFGPDLSGLLAASLGACLASLLALFLICRKAISLRGIGGLAPGLVKNLLTFGGWVTASGMIGPLLVTFDRFVIGAMLGAAAVSIYTVPYNLVSRVQIVPAALAGVLFPRFAATAEAEHGDRLEIESIAVLAAIMTPICVGAMAVISPFLVVWIGRELALQSAPVAYLILFGFWANSVARIPYSRLLGTGRPGLITKITAIQVPPYLGLLFLGVSEFGVAGAAAAWCLRTVADTIIFLAFVGNRRAAFRMLAVPTLLAGLALITAIFTPMESPLRWVILTTAFVTSVLWSLWNMPQPLRTWKAKLLKRFSRRQPPAVREESL